MEAYDVARESLNGQLKLHIQVVDDSNSKGEMHVSKENHSEENDKEKQEVQPKTASDCIGEIRKILEGVESIDPYNVGGDEEEDENGTIERASKSDDDLIVMETE